MVYWGWTGDFYPQFKKGFIATSGIQDVPAVIEKLELDVKNGTFVAQAWLPSFSDNMLRLGTWSPSSPAEAKATGEKAAEAIKSGEKMLRLFSLYRACLKVISMSKLKSYHQNK
ncbi:hypothetical protein AZF37_07385 [endosymbiont 'TC1' of Trimyema compressum]|uniref:hypothetical protein n=1 Tax=endosymbiont 'TC1' of Trimyema compressum TaxID=243899 RepID=UPI0007F0C1D1|nr:hypothetical protein [endosymbiont 'TC1' of Trimyema compressum]AMP21006.1 hypothetical protein AZF37_07385 [endosymbiont 'TC1' of Trimyema compressum]